MCHIVKALQLRNILLHHRGHLIGNGRGLLQAGPDGHSDGHRYLALIHFRNQHHVGGKAADRKQSHQAYRHQHAHLEMAGKVLQQMEVFIIQPVNPAADFGRRAGRLFLRPAQSILTDLFLIQHHVAQQRHQRQCNGQRAQDQKGNGQAEVLEHHACDTAGKSQGQEHCYRSQRRRHDGRGHFLGSFHACAHAVVSL